MLSARPIVTTLISLAAMPWKGSWTGCLARGHETAEMDEGQKVWK